MKTKDIFRHIIIWGTVAVLIVFVATGNVAFRRYEPLNNDPLKAAVDVSEVSSDKLVLADGRVILMDLLQMEFIAVPRVWLFSGCERRKKLACGVLTCHKAGHA